VLRLFKIIKRRPMRHTVKLNCQVVRERDFRLIADRIDNLSTWGALVTPADPVLTGERLLVSFQVPRHSVWIDTEATVTRVVHGRRPGEHSRSLGLEFDELRPWHRYLLKQALSAAPPAPPGPRPGRRQRMSARELARLMPMPSLA
jgi:hypothetical protein